MKLFEIAGPETIEEFISQHCSQFIKTLGEDVSALFDEEKSLKLSLYRGVDLVNAKEIRLIIDGKEQRCFIKNVRKDRKPRDTQTQLSDIINEALEKKFGWKPRTEGIFCFGWRARGAMNDFGVPCKIYPMGPVPTVYSPEVKDITPMIYRAITDNGIELKYGEEMTPEKYAQVQAVVAKFIEDNNYSDDLRAAIESGRSEIMIGCDQYLAIPFTSRS